MKSVSVIATFHAELGLVTTAALEVIVSRLDPDVLFLECPPAGLERYLNCERGSPTSPEAAVARRLNADGRVALVPVDLPTPEASFFMEHKELIGKVERRSRDFRNLHDLQIHNVRTCGFPYLNSDQSDTLLAMIEDETKLAVDLYEDPVLDQAYARWAQQKQDREAGMVQAIEAYFEQQEAQRGVLMVGAAHRKALMTSTKVRPDGTRSLLRWDFAAAASAP